MLVEFRYCSDVIWEGKLSDLHELPRIGEHVVLKAAAFVVRQVIWTLDKNYPHVTISLQAIA